MKRVVQIVLMGIWCAFFLNGEQLKQDKWNVTIEGKILHPVTSIVRIVGPDVNLQTRLDSEGKFKVKAFIKVAGYYKFINKENAPLYLKPGDRLNLTLDSRQFDETLSYRGSGADINNYLIRKYLVMEQRFYNRERDVFSMKKAGFISRIESIFSQIHLLLTKLEPSKADRNSGFMELEKKMLFLEKAELYFVYPKEYRKNTRKDGENMDAVFAELIKQIDTNDSTQLSQAKYREVLKLILDKKTRDRFGKDASSQQFTDEFAKMKIMTAIDQFKDKKIREYLVYSTAWHQIQKGAVNRDLYNRIMRQLSHKKWKHKLAKMYKMMQKLQKGMAAPPIHCINTEGKQVSLADFKGKLVYIDVWSTQCNPCLKEIPYLEAFARKNNQLVVLSISIDNDIEDWKKMLKKRKMKGIQLYAEGGWQSDFARNYVIWSTPTYILIDKKGRIKSVRAPGPREGIEKLIVD